MELIKWFGWSVVLGIVAGVSCCFGFSPFESAMHAVVLSIAFDIHGMVK